MSVVIPVYNERDYILELLHEVQTAPCALEKEIIVVDDSSTDGTRELLEEIQAAEQNFTDENLADPLPVDNIRVLYQPENRGKGAALRQGFNEASGEVVVVQDADLEYNPAEYEKMLEPILAGNADVVYGSRFLGGPHRVLYFWHYAGNKMLTLLANMVSNLNLTDMETCYKMFRRGILEGLELEENGFGIEPEITIKVARQNCRVYELPIAYHGRTYEEGKKIGWADGLIAIWCILKYGVTTLVSSADKT